MPTAEMTRIAAEASIAVLILANPEITDVDFIPLKPRMMSPAEQAELRNRWPGRNLSSIGAFGMVGAVPKVALKVPLDDRQVTALSAACAAYIATLLGGSLAEQLAAQLEAAELAELERLWLLPDTRPN